MSESEPAFSVPSPSIVASIRPVSTFTAAAPAMPTALPLPVEPASATEPESATMMLLSRPSIAAAPPIVIVLALLPRMIDRALSSATLATTEPEMLMPDLPVSTFGAASVGAFLNFACSSAMTLSYFAWLFGHLPGSSDLLPPPEGRPDWSAGVGGLGEAMAAAMAPLPMKPEFSALMPSAPATFTSILPGVAVSGWAPMTARVSRSNTLMMTVAPMLVPPEVVLAPAKPML